MSAGSECKSAGPRVLVVFAKEPRAGHVKTRMTPALSPERAADFYAAMLEDVLAESGRVCDALELDGVLTVSPASACERFAARAPTGFCIVAQQAGDLGARMAHEVARALERGASKVVLRGSDNPALGQDAIEALFDALDEVDLAVSPDRDGGYGAIGMRVPAGEVFAHEMSTEDVLGSTLARAERAGFSTRKTEGCFDLDTTDDLAWLAAARAALPGDRCPKTLAFADTHGLWPRNATPPPARPPAR